MCLDVIPGTTRKVAQKDFFIYKIITKDDKSPSMGFPYVPNKTYKLGKEIRQKNGVVDPGFHAFRTVKDARSSHWRQTHKIVPMIVPKGTRYYVGTNGEIASETIKTFTLDDVR